MSVLVAFDPKAAGPRPPPIGKDGPLGSANSHHEHRDGIMAYLRRDWCFPHVVETQFIGIRALKEFGPSDQISPRHLKCAKRSIYIAPRDPSPKFVDGQVEKTQDRPGADLARRSAEDVSFISRPNAPVNDHIAAKLKGAHSGKPLQPLDPAPERTSLRFGSGHVGGEFL
jgi:hypothetical protein